MEKRRTPYRVLVADDEVIIAEDLRQRLVQAGFEVIGPVSSGVEAIALARSKHPDVAIMDILLRGNVDGVEAATTITQELSVPIVFVTACSDVATVDRARALPMSTLLVKPFEDRELHLAMELALTRKQLVKMDGQHERREERSAASRPAGVNQYCVLGCDNDGVIRFVGGIARSMLGFKPEMIGAATIYDLFEDGSQQHFRGNVAVALGGKTVQMEAKLKESSDPRKWIALTIAPQNGKGFLVVAEDGTEDRRNLRKQASLYSISEAAHTVSGLDELYRSIHRCVSEVLPAKNFYIAIRDPETDILAFPYFVDEFDPPPGQRSMRKGLTEYVLRTGQPLLASPERFNELVARGDVESIGVPSVDWLGVPLVLDGSPFGVLVVQTYSDGVRYTQEDLNLLSFVSHQVAMAIDRKRKEETLRTSEAELRTLFEAMDAVVLVMDAGGRILSIAPTNPSILHRLPERFQQSTVDAAFPRPQAEYFHERIHTALHQGGRLALGFPMELSGQVRWFEGTLSPAGLDRVVLVAHDVTDRRMMENSYHEAQETYKGIFDHAAMGIAKYTVDGRFLSVNNALMKMYGYENQHELLAEMTRRKGQLYVDPQRHQEFQSMLQSGGEIVDFESQVTRNIGGPFWISENVRLVRDEAHNPLYYIETVQDITAKKLAERELRLLANTVACARDCFLLTSLDGSILFVNDSFVATYGFPADEIVGKSPLILGGKDMSKAVLKEAYLPASGSWVGELQACRTNGTEFPAEVLTSTVRDETGKPLAFVTVARDITDRKQSEEKIRHNDLRLRRITDTMLDVVTQIDTHGVCEYASPSHAKVLGYRPESLVGTRTLSLVHPADRARVFATFQKLHNGRASGTAEYRLRSADDRWIWVESLINPLQDDDGNVTGFVVGSMDVSRRKKADEAIRLNEARLEALVALNQMFDSSTEDVAEVALEDGVRLTRSAIGFVGFLNPGGGALESVIWSKHTLQICQLEDVQSLTSLSPSGMFQSVIKRREPVIMNRFPGSGGACATVPTKHVSLYRFMAVPVFDGSEVVAIAGVGNKREDYDASDARQLTLLFEGMVGHMQRQKAQQELRQSLEEKEILLKEVHHRVKNNLQIISSLLSLQLGRIEDASIVQLLRESQNRIRSMALIHERLYRSGDLSRIDFGTYVHNLTSYLVRSYPNAKAATKIRINIEGILLGVDLAIPCGLIVNELVSNSLIHAFPDGREGEVVVEMTRNESVARLCVRDNGVGFPEGFNIRNASTLGLQLIETLVDQIDGVTEVDEGRGTSFSVVFKAP